MFVGGCAQLPAVCRSGAAPASSAAVAQTRLAGQRALGRTGHGIPPWACGRCCAGAFHCRVSTIDRFQGRSLQAREARQLTQHTSFDPSHVCFVPRGLEARRVTLIFVSKISVTVVLSFKTRCFVPQSSADAKAIPCQRPGPSGCQLYSVRSSITQSDRQGDAANAKSHKSLVGCRLLSNHPGNE